MRRSHYHRAIYYLLGKAAQGFLLLLYGFGVACLLVLVFAGVTPAWTVFRTGFPWFVRGGLTLGCGTTIVSLLESL